MSLLKPRAFDVTVVNWRSGMALRGWPLVTLVDAQKTQVQVVVAEGLKVFLPAELERKCQLMTSADGHLNPE